MNEIPAGVPEAAPWSMFAGALGRGSVLAAVVFFVLAALAMVVARKDSRLEKAGAVSFVLGCLSLFTAFGSLALLFVRNQFQYQYVWGHSDTTTSIAYKIASVWTAQEGSFLLWGCGSAVFALLALAGTGIYRRGFVGVYSLFLASLGGILAYETPFKIIPQLVAHGKTFVPPEGNGMVPSLQNYWVIIHPPVIFLGFGSLAVLAAYAVAAMLNGDAEDWVARVRPWALVSTAILGLGICMGGLWAYETQGWGGFWAWDPVENVSFVPWLFVVTLAHGLIVQATRRKWAGTNLFLGGVPFLLFVYGTYLTRSGLLDKVSNHSFATMDDHARGILKIFLIASIVLFGGLYWLRGREAARVASAHTQPDEAGLSREGFYRYGMLLIGLMSAVIALGMSWPVITAARGGEGSAIKEPVYHLVVTWFFLPLMVLMATAPFVSWRKMEGVALRERLFGVVCISIGLTGMLHLFLLSTPFGVRPEAGAMVAAPFGRAVPLALWMLVLLFSVVFVLVANVWRVGELVKRSPMGVGGFVSHLGLAVLMGGLILSRGYERKAILMIRDGHPESAMGYTVAYRGMSTTDFYDRERKVEFDVTGPRGERFVSRPGHYRYQAGQEIKDQVWPSIERFPTHDVYLAMSPPIVFATEEPIPLKPGETKDVAGSMLEYVESTRQGEFGQMGTKFGAKVRLTETDANGERRQYLANPTVELSQDGLQPSIAQIGPNFKVALVGPVNPADKSVQVALMFSPPVYQVELYEKPFTGLVWLGTGILTLGGMLSAFARRRVVAARRKATTPQRNDAPIPAPQS
jgi:cytochrome c-type biogenesis protein CcmF